MHKFIGFIAAAFAVLGALSIAMMFYGNANEGGMAVLAFQLWGLIGTIAALAFALISRFIAKRANIVPHGSTRIALNLGFFTLAALVIGMVTIG